MCGVMYDCMTCLDFALCYTCYLSREVIHNSDHHFQTSGSEYQTESEQSEPADSESENDNEEDDEDEDEDEDEDKNKDENKEE